MMMQWKQLLTQSWTRRLRSPPHVSVTAAVLLVFASLSFFLLLLLLLSSTSVSTLSIAGSAALLSSLTSSNLTAGFFFTDMYNNITETPAAPQLHASDIASDVGIPHQEDNSSATKLHNVDSSNAVATVMLTLPSIDQSVLIPALSPAAPPQQNFMVQLEEEEVHDVERLIYGVDADQNLNIDWSPVAAAAAAAPSVLRDKMSRNKPEDIMMNHTEEEDLEEEKEASITTTVTSLQPLLLESSTPSPSPAAAAVLFQDEERQSAAEVEKFLVPILSYQVGAGNQLMEYMSAAIMARALNRTLCLADFFPGPRRHTGGSVRGGGGLAMEDRYDKDSLSRFVRVTSKKNCLQQCHRKLDAWWLLKPMRRPKVQDWKSMPRVETNETLHLSWDYVRWQTPADIAKRLGSFSNAHCVAVGGLFPGLRWRGLHPDAKEWIEMSKDQCKNRALGVGLDKFDLFNAIFDRAQNYSLKTVYLATDGWIRGPHGAALVKETVEELRNRGLAVVGLWNIKQLPNFPDGTTFDPKSTLGTRTVNGHQIALVEQEICTRSNAFLGSSQSTWSLAVFRLRLARRRVKQILESHLDVTRAESSGILQQQGDKSPGAAIKKRDLQQEEDDEAVIEELMKDNHAAGLQCRYARYFNRIRANETVETYADEVPDGWLDLEACEGRIGHGGKCTVAKCI
ncbi:unnamed protein product [Sphagnum jensenii]